MIADYSFMSICSQERTVRANRIVTGGLILERLVDPCYIHLWGRYLSNA